VHHLLQGKANSADDLALLNAEGAAGYRGRTYLYRIADVDYHIFAKDTGSAATWRYEFKPQATSDGGFNSELDAQGARGFFFHNEYIYNDARVAIYEKNDASAITFDYDNLAPQPTLADWLRNANALGAGGTATLGDYILPSNTQRQLTVKPANCPSGGCRVGGFLID
jgi:hypothetical protein